MAAAAVAAAAAAVLGAEALAWGRHGRTEGAAHTLLTSCRWTSSSIVYPGAAAATDGWRAPVSTLRTHKALGGVHVRGARDSSSFVLGRYCSFGRSLILVDPESDF